MGNGSVSRSCSEKRKIPRRGVEPSFAALATRDFLPFPALHLDTLGGAQIGWASRLRSGRRSISD